MPSSHSIPRFTDKGSLVHGGGAAGRGSRSGVACRVQTVFFLLPALAVIVYCGALFATSVAFPLENLVRAAGANPEGFVAHANVQMLVGNVFDALLLSTRPSL